jgi:hypothetical protein
MRELLVRAVDYLAVKPHRNYIFTGHSYLFAIAKNVKDISKAPLHA